MISLSEKRINQNRKEARESPKTRNKLTLTFNYAQKQKPSEERQKANKVPQRSQNPLWRFHLSPYPSPTQISLRSLQTTPGSTPIPACNHKRRHFLPAKCQKQHETVNNKTPNSLKGSSLQTHNRNLHKNQCFTLFLDKRTT